MLCRNCNYILSGEEDFCPHCGQATKQQDVNERVTDNKDTPLVTDELPKITYNSSIFESEPDPSDEGMHEKNKNKAAKGLVALFAVILLAIAGFTAVEYFNLTPAIASFIASVGGNETTTQEQTITSSQDSSVPTQAGLLAPEINYKPAVCIVTGKESLPLRKGPGDAYAPIGTVPCGTRLQITGGCMENDIWVYAYIPSMDVYGWLSASFLAAESSVESTDLSSETKENESTSAESTENKKEDESKQALSQGSYKAKVTAEKGLYLRVGPGVDFEALRVIGKGEEVTVIEICAANPKWVYVEFDGDKGYVSENYVSKI